MPQELLKLSNIGSKGLNTDLSPWELPPGFITSGENFRVYSGKLIAAGGSKSFTIPPVSFNAGHIYAITTPSGDFWISLGRIGTYVFNGSTWTEITPIGGYPSIGLDDELKWTSSSLGQIPLFNNPQDFPQFWSPQDAGTKLQFLDFEPGITWKDKGFSCEVLRTHKTFIFALNLHEGQFDIPDGYRWSTSADINGLPFTWDETDLSGLAGRASLGGNGGQIIDGLSLRDSFVIYSETSIDILDFTGGEFIWKSRELSSTYGLLSINSIVEIKGVHYFLSDGDIFLNDGTNVKSILYGRIRDQFAARINPDVYFRSFVVRNDSFKEVWFCVPIDSSEFPNAAFIYNWHEDTWAIRKLPDGLVYANHGHQSAATSTWDTFEGTWDSQETVWGSRTVTPLNTTAVGVIGSNSELVILDPRDTKDSPPEVSFIERDNLVLVDHRQVTTITRIYPHIEGTSPVLISIGSQEFAGAPIRWKPSVRFRPGIDRKVDIRTTGELHSWKIETDLSDQIPGTGNWQVSGLDIEFIQDGLR